MSAEEEVFELEKATSSDDLEQGSKADSEVIDLDSSRNSDVNTSDCVMITETDEPAVSESSKPVDFDKPSNMGLLQSKDDVETDTGTAQNNISDVPDETIASKSAKTSAKAATEDVLGENASVNSTKQLEIDAGPLNEMKNVTDDVANEAENPEETAATEMESDAQNEGKDMEIVAETTINQGHFVEVIHSEDEAERTSPLLNTSVINLDTPEKDELPAAVTVNTSETSEPIEIDNDDLSEPLVVECISKLVQSVVLLDGVEKDQQSVMTIDAADVEKSSEASAVGGGSSQNTKAKPHSGCDDDLDTPEKTDGDNPISDVIALADTQNDSNMAPSVDEKSGDIESESSPEKVESTKVDEIFVVKPSEIEAESSSVTIKNLKSDESELTKNIECTHQSVETSSAASIQATTTESVKANEEAGEKSSKADNAGKTDSELVDTVDTSREPESKVSQADDRVATDTTMPSIESTKKCDQPAEVNVNIEVDNENDKQIDEIGGKAADQEMNDTPAVIEIENGKNAEELDGRVDEHMEMNDGVPASTDTEALIPMEIDEGSGAPKGNDEKMECEDSNEIGAADELVSTEAEKIIAEPLDGEAKSDPVTAPEELNSSPTSVENDEKVPERAPVIRVKSMAFLFSDAPDEGNLSPKPSTGAETNTADAQSKANADTVEKLIPKKKLKPKQNRLLSKVLKNVLGDTVLSSGEQNDSDSDARSPSTGPASPASATENEPEPPTPKRLSLPAVKECLNIECSHKSREFFEAPEFVISHFLVTKKSKTLFVCDECFESAIAKYGALCGALEDKVPLYMEEIPRRPEFVEILDSSDEEDPADVSPNTSKEGDANVSILATTFSPDTLAMIENELENVITSSLQRINISEQMEWNRQILHQKLNSQMTASLAILGDLKHLQRTADRIYKDTYKGINSFVEEISSYDCDTHKPFQLSNATYPPSGEFKHEDELDPSVLYYTVRKNLISVWTPCRFLEKINLDGTDMYKVQLLRQGKNKTNPMRMVTRKYLAYGKAPPNRLDVGTRCIALYKMMGEMNAKHAAFYPGVIAEPLREYNKWRYLVFFDDGYAQYIVHDDVRVVCEASDNVWEDVVIESREFIETYLQQFSKMRPMVQVQRGQRMMTEWMGKWTNAIVNAVDASLVQMYFEDEKRYEWIYRGSTRLGPLYRQNKQQPKPKGIPKVINLIDKTDKVESSTSAPVATATSTSSSEAPPIQRTFPAQATRDTPQKQREKRVQAEQQEKEKRAVAKKSTTLPPRPTVQHLNNSTIYVDEDNKPKGKVVYYTAKRHLPPRKYTSHACSPSCLFEITHNLSTYSPLSKPLLSGWERQICKAKGKKSVVYKAPCGRRLRNMSELHRYLRMTNCSLNVENFDYDFMIHCLAEYVIDTCIINKPDISEGVESMVVPCVNYYDTTMPPPCVYSAKRIPTEGVNLNSDASFMCGCDCTDDCLDKTKCQCWQLTIAGAKYGNPYTPPEEIGYEFKRLPEPVPTGIYECNSQCKCKSSCLNRVAQQPLQMKLQVFKTGNRGWGLRCLNDVPKGSFICCYAGNLLTEQVANEAGENLGDEYFAELDYIEVVEGLKEGYEPEVMNDDDQSSEEEFDPDGEPGDKDDSDDEEFVSKAYIGDRRIKTRYRTRNSIDTKKKDEKKKEEKKKKDADDSSDDERQPISFMPSQTPIQEENTAAKSIRKFFGKNEAVYIMDAKKTGNIGRYFNHSCSPNLFVQNVFVDTHDLRFPWVAFFASSHIRAGTELTWNYNYDVGSVPGKVLYCQCGADNCRGRLL